jgi:hypothetical protein
MDEEILCRRCRGRVVVTRAITGSLKCPKCGEIVYIVDPETGAAWKAPDPAPTWMKPLGWIFFLVGILGFCASAYTTWPQKRYPSSEDYWGAMIAGVLNPLFFVGVPLGLYWLSRCGELRRMFPPPEPSARRSEPKVEPTLPAAGDSTERNSKRAGDKPADDRPTTPA